MNWIKINESYEDYYIGKLTDKVHDSLLMAYNEVNNRGDEYSGEDRFLDDSQLDLILKYIDIAKQNIEKIKSRKLDD